MITVLIIVVFLFGIVLGVPLGYWICNRDNKKISAKVAKMTWSETLRKYQESEKR